MIIAYWNNKSINIGKERLPKVHDRDSAWTGNHNNHID
jgi:hypothetical protein